MKALALIVLMVTVAGCGQAAKDEQAVRARDAAMNAAVAKMIVTREKSVPAHPNSTTLGNVQGFCRENPEADDRIPEGDNLREAAYRKYGDRVDAIVGAYRFFVPSTTLSQAGDPMAKQGHFECAGTAVHFAEAAPPAAN